jgi:hypothetical protein
MVPHFEIFMILIFFSLSKQAGFKGSRPFRCGSLPPDFVVFGPRIVMRLFGKMAFLRLTGGLYFGSDAQPWVF